MKRIHMGSTMQFVLPITVDNCISILVTQLSSTLVGMISLSALAAVGTVNTVISVCTAMFGMLTTGAVVLTARLVGAHESMDASDMIEQSISFLIIGSVVLTALFLGLAEPVMRLLMPTAEDVLVQESVIYFRMIAISFPFLMMVTLFGGILRASGNSRAPMVIGMACNFVQLVSAWLFIMVFDWGLYGAGAACIVGRVLSSALQFAVIVRSDTLFMVRARNILRPRRSAFVRMFHIGFPMSVESVLVQGGYMLANSLAVGLGTMNAAIYQVCNAVNNFNAIPQNISLAATTSLVGRELGDNQRDRAYRMTRSIWIVGVACSVLISAVMAFFGRQAAGMYTQSAEVVESSLPILWLMVAMNIPAMSINVIDPSLRAGGDAKFVMINSLIAVWVIRIPLTWLLTYQLEMGIVGVYIANFISFLPRALLGIFRFLSGKWIHSM